MAAMATPQRRTSLVPTITGSRLARTVLVLWPGHGEAWGGMRDGVVWLNRHRSWISMGALSAAQQPATREYGSMGAWQHGSVSIQDSRVSALRDGFKDAFQDAFKPPSSKGVGLRAGKGQGIGNGNGNGACMGATWAGHGMGIMGTMDTMNTLGWRSSVVAEAQEHGNETMGSTAISEGGSEVIGGRVGRVGAGWITLDQSDWINQTGPDRVEVP